MAYDYEDLYRDTPDALGAPNADIAAFFDGRAGPLRVLDIGCGQGRDALPVARQGHHVHGVDLSPSGVRDMVQVARAEGLDVTGQVADLAGYTPDGTYDVLLIDRTLHMLAAAPRHAVLARLLTHLRADGWLLLVDEKSNMAGLRAVMHANSADWSVIREKAGLLFAQRRT